MNGHCAVTLNCKRLGVLNPTTLVLGACLSFFGGKAFSQEVNPFVTRSEFDSPRSLGLGGTGLYGDGDLAATMRFPAQRGAPPPFGGKSPGVSAFPGLTLLANRSGLALSRQVFSADPVQTRSSEIKKIINRLNDREQAFFRASLSPYAQTGYFTLGLQIESGTQISRSSQSSPSGPAAFDFYEHSGFSPNLNVALPYKIKGILSSLGFSVRYVYLKQSYHFVDENSDPLKSLSNFNKGNKASGLGFDAGLQAHFAKPTPNFDARFGLSVRDLGNTVLKGGGVNSGSLPISGGSLDRQNATIPMTVAAQSSVHFKPLSHMGISSAIETFGWGQGNLDLKEKWAWGGELAWGGAARGGLGGAPFSVQLGCNGGGLGGGVGMNLFFVFLELGTGMVSVPHAMGKGGFERLYSGRITVDLSN